MAHRRDDIALFLFRRDLRLEDNTALDAALEWARKRDVPTKVVCAFAFPEDQINPNKNKYFSNAAVQFMCESLEDLAKNLEQLGTKLHILQCSSHVDYLRAVSKNVGQKRLVGVFFNKDHSVYANKRDKEIIVWCKANEIYCPDDMHDLHDYDLVKPDEGLLPDGRAYTNLSQYYNKFVKGLLTVDKPKRGDARKTDFTILSSSLAGLKDIEWIRTLYKQNEELAQKGGRQEGIKILKMIKDGSFAKYGHDRDFPALDATTKSSAHLHFGTVSIREMYWALRDKYGADNPLIRELVFRSFYIKIYTHNDKLQRGMAFQDEMDKKVPWISPKSAEGREYWQRWINGTTGFPLVDAGMRQLAATGWMHNRVRMLVATTATRYFMLDWRDCAKFFYSQLVDADTFSNTAGWQWSAGIGPDSAPYFRAPMNPFIQSKKFDEDAVYIKRWVPELADIPAKDIHKWDQQKIRDKYKDTSKYPAPVIEQKEASRRATETFKNARKA